MKKIVLFIFAIALLTTGAFAQSTKKATKKAPAKTTAPVVTAPKVTCSVCIVSYFDLS